MVGERTDVLSCTTSYNVPNVYFALQPQFNKYQHIVVYFCVINVKIVKIMSSSDSSEYLPDQDEFEESDISDSDEEFSDSEFEDETEPRCFGNWKIVTNPFEDVRDTDLIEHTYDYDIHPAIGPGDMNSPRKCFEAFVSSKIVRQLCSWTNTRAMMYFEEKCDYEMKVNSLKWRDVTEQEMYIFMALIFLMGLIHLPRISDYWRRKFLLGGPPVFSAKVMSRNR